MYVCFLFQIENECRQNSQESHRSRIKESLIASCVRRDPKPRPHDDSQNAQLRHNRNCHSDYDLPVVVWLSCQASKHEHCQRCGVDIVVIKYLGLPENSAPALVLDPYIASGCNGGNRRLLLLLCHIYIGTLFLYICVILSHIFMPGNVLRLYSHSRRPFRHGGSTLSF